MLRKSLGSTFDRFLASKVWFLRMYGVRIRGGDKFDTTDAMVMELKQKEYNYFMSQINDIIIIISATAHSLLKKGLPQ